MAVKPVTVYKIREREGEEKTNCFRVAQQNYNNKCFIFSHAVSIMLLMVWQLWL